MLPQVSFLDDVKTNSQTDSNAAKTIALDHLGVIAARIRTSILKVQQEIRETASRKALKPLDEVAFFFLTINDSLMMMADRLQRRYQTS